MTLIMFGLLSQVASAADAPAVKFNGDFRLRNETINQEGSVARNRDRIRVRAGLAAEVNSDVTAVVQLTTADNADARSPNQTLTDANSKKSIALDLAYVNWKVDSTTQVTLGKMKQPFTKSQSVFFDSDITPEGFAVIKTLPYDLYVNAFTFDLAERSTATDARLNGLQLGTKKTVLGQNVTAAVGYFDHTGVEKTSVVQAGSAGGSFGNTTSGGILTNDYNILDVVVNADSKVANYPVAFSVEYAKNTKALNKSQDTATAVGVTVGKASAPKSWEAGVLYQQVQKDALFAQWIDSDFGGGSTDSKGLVFRGTYVAAKNVKLSGTYYVNTINNSTTNIDYHRLMLDAAYSF